MDTNENNRKVTAWLKELSQGLGIELPLNDQGICSFQIGENTIITLEVSPDFPLIHLYSPLHSLPEEDRNFELIIRALELNAHQELTHGGAIAIAPGGQDLIFCFNVLIEDLDAEKFAEILETFFQTVSGIKYLLTETPVLNVAAKQAYPPSRFKI